MNEGLLHNENKIDEQKMSDDVDAFLIRALSEEPNLTKQITDACSALDVDFEEFRMAAHNYAMIFTNSADNSIYNETATSLANYHCMHVNGSYHRVRHMTTFEWLKRINPKSITDCGYSAPTDYMLDEQFVTERKINLVEGSSVGEKVTRVILDINHIPTQDISFEVKNMNDFEYLGDSDAYVFLDSIEHASDPDKYLRTQVTNAKYGSYFILSIPIGKIDSFKNFHFKEWKTDDEAKDWVEENGLEIVDTNLAIPNPEVDIFTRPIIGGFHNLLLLCKKETAYDSAPTDYTEGAKKFFTENPDAEKPTTYMLEKIRPLIQSADVADIGCGDAPNLDFYISNGAKHISLIDPAKNILKVLRERLKDHPELENVDLQIGDYENNSLNEGGIDLAVSRFSLHYNNDIDSSLSKVHEKLKPGGNLFVIVPHPDDKQNQVVFERNGKEYIRINLYGTFVVEYPVHTLAEYFSDLIKEKFDVIEDRTFTYEELGLNNVHSGNAVLYIHLQKKVTPDN